MIWKFWVLIRFKNLGNLHLDGPFQKKVHIGITGDKGGTTTKIGFQIANVHRPNSTSNFTLLAMWVGDHAYKILIERLQPVMKQIGGLATKIGEYEVCWCVFHLNIIFLVN